MVSSGNILSIVQPLKRTLLSAKHVELYGRCSNGDAAHRRRPKAMGNRTSTSTDCIANLEQHHLMATKTAPAVIRPIPNQFVAESRSLKNMTPKIATKTTLNLSIGATRAASPSFNARK
jgi:hypothetical protein